MIISNDKTKNTNQDGNKIEKNNKSDTKDREGVQFPITIETSADAAKKVSSDESKGVLPTLPTRNSCIPTHFFLFHYEDYKKIPVASIRTVSDELNRGDSNLEVFGSTDNCSKVLIGVNNSSDTYVKQVICNALKITSEAEKEKIKVHFLV